MIETGPFSADHGHGATAPMLSARPAPTAIISGSDQIFPGALAAIRQRNLSIPADLSLATFDDIPLLGLLEPTIAVVRCGPQEFGTIAANLLLRRLSTEGPETVVVPTSFEQRGSSAPPHAAKGLLRSRWRSW